MPTRREPAPAPRPRAPTIAVVEREHEAGLFGERHERARFQHPARRAASAPAPPRRRCDRCAAPPRAGTTRRSRRWPIASRSSCSSLEPALDRLAELDVEDLDAIAAALLRAVLRGVGVGEQRPRRRRPDRGSSRCRCSRTTLKRRPGDLERARRTPRRRAPRSSRLRAVVQPVEQHRELVAAEPGEHVVACA